MSQKRAEELCVITLKNDAKFEEELTCTLTNDIRLLLTKVIMFELKSTEELCVMTMNGDAIFKEKLTDGLKNDIRNLVNFHASSRKSENVHFNGFVFSKAYKVSDEKVQKSYVS